MAPSKSGSGASDGGSAAFTGGIAAGCAAPAAKADDDMLWAIRPSRAAWASQEQRSKPQWVRGLRCALVIRIA